MSYSDDYRYDLNYIDPEEESDRYDNDDELYTDDDIVGERFEGDVHDIHVKDKFIKSDRSGCYIIINGSKHYLTVREVRHFKEMDFEEDDEI